MSEEIFNYFLIYVLINIVLLIVYKFTNRLKVLHRILSLLDNIVFCLILGYDFYRIEHIFVIFVPCVLLIVYPISWGLNKELSDEDVASVVELRSLIPLKKESRVKMKVAFAHFATFPFFYLLDSWKKSEN